MSACIHACTYAGTTYLATCFCHCCSFACHQGFKYLYLAPEDYKKVSTMNSVNAELIEDEGESRYKIIDVIGEWETTPGTQERVGRVERAFVT